MGCGSLGLVRPGVVVSEELVASNRPAEHEIEANLVFDGFDVRWIAVNIVVGDCGLPVFETARSRRCLDTTCEAYRARRDGDDPSEG